MALNTIPRIAGNGYFPAAARIVRPGLVPISAELFQRFIRRFSVPLGPDQVNVLLFFFASASPLRGWIQGLSGLRTPLTFQRARLVLPGVTPGYAVNTPSVYRAPGGSQFTLGHAASTILLIGSIYYTCATNWPQKKFHAPLIESGSRFSPLHHHPIEKADEPHGTPNRSAQTP
jgi:hypothetical protein